MKHPWMKFYPQDWRGDAKLRRCSRAARSLWLDMLGLMHEATPYGHLVMDGQKLDSVELGKIFGDSTRTVRVLLAELADAGVFSTTPDGVIYSRRMVRDEQTRERRAAGGVRSLDNPNVPRPKDGNKESTKDILPTVHDGPTQIPDTRSQSTRGKSKATTSVAGAPGRVRPPVTGSRRPSWLEPAAASWEAKFGAGSFAWGEGGKALKPLEQAGHEPEEIAKRLTRYLAKTETQFASIHRFAKTFGDHGPLVLKGPEVVDLWMSPEVERLTRSAGYVG